MNDGLDLGRARILDEFRKETPPALLSSSRGISQTTWGLPSHSVTALGVAWIGKIVPLS
ncbi:hypothetical protein GCM10027038_18970 [Arthrobacter bambusae]